MSDSRFARLLQEFTHRDHTQGRLLVSIFVLALPAVLSSSGMAVFQLFDLRFLGQIGDEAVAAAGATKATRAPEAKMSAAATCAKSWLWVCAVCTMKRRRTMK